MHMYSYVTRTRTLTARVTVVTSSSPCQQHASTTVAAHTACIKGTLLARPLQPARLSQGHATPHGPKSSAPSRLRKERLLRTRKSIIISAQPSCW
mgnify:CR=1 FL=1